MRHVTLSWIGVPNHFLSVINSHFTGLTYGFIDQDEVENTYINLVVTFCHMFCFSKLKRSSCRNRRALWYLVIEIVSLLGRVNVHSHLGINSTVGYYPRLYSPGSGRFAVFGVWRNFHSFACHRSKMRSTLA